MAKSSDATIPFDPNPVASPSKKGHVTCPTCGEPLEEHCAGCGFGFSRDEQQKLIDEAILATYADTRRPNSQRAIAKSLPRFLRADHKRVGRRIKHLQQSGALPQLDRTVGLDGKERPSDHESTGQHPRPNERKENRYYTPHWAIEALLDREMFEGTTWEPACGDGRIVEAFRKVHLNCVGTDVESGTDFLATTKDVTNVVTNPPFELKREFVVHAKECAQQKVVMLLEMNVVKGHANFNTLWADRHFPLARVYPFVRAVKFQSAATGEEYGLWFACAWFVWDRSHRGKPTLAWIE